MSWSEAADIAEQHHEHHRAEANEHRYPQSEWQRAINCRHMCRVRGVCITCGDNEGDQ